MPVWMWVARVNKRVFNPRELSRGDRPVLTHIGRSSGNTYRTPLDAHPVDGGYIFIVMYGSDSDWVRNVLAAGTATLEIDGNELDLVSPRLVSKEDAWQLLSAATKAPPSFLRVTEYLRMDVHRQR
jgi:deazaflavin-dependent oxidoreductase (nitroreductase family)